MHGYGPFGLAVLVGLLVFCALNAVFTLVTAACSGSAWVIGGCTAQMVAGVTNTSLYQLYNILTVAAYAGQAVEAIALVLAVASCLIAGLLAGLIARGGAGNGFEAGFFSGMIGSYVMLGSAIAYLSSNNFPVAALFNPIPLIPFVGFWVLTPLLAGIVAGIGGMVFAAALGPRFALVYRQPAQPASTTIIQMPPHQQAPVVIKA